MVLFAILYLSTLHGRALDLIKYQMGCKIIITLDGYNIYGYEILQFCTWVAGAHVNQRISIVEQWVVVF